MRVSIISILDAAIDQHEVAYGEKPHEIVMSMDEFRTLKADAKRKKLTNFAPSQIIGSGTLGKYRDVDIKLNASVH